VIQPRRRPPAARRPALHGLILGLVTLSAFFSYQFTSDFPFQHRQAGAIAGLSLPSVGPAQSGQSVLTSSVLPVTVRRQDVASAGDSAPMAAAQLPTATAAPALPFQLYAVAEGDTASAIASRYGIGLQYLLAANAELRDGELLTVGQMLIIPASDGVLYHLRYGETLSDVAGRFGVTVQDIIGYGGNSIASADQVTEGQLVFVPGGIPPVSVLPEPAPVVAVAASVEAPPVVAADTAPVPSVGLVWPVGGPISSYYGPSHPLGIDIDLFNNPYAAVAAATSGTVTFVGGDPCCSYGYYVIVVSPDGIETLYAHFSSFNVSVGQTVNQGDILGNAGCTGYCTGNHLHFEVIDNGVRVDPLGYLP
jgi:murein DD-endopeptidase MepM/ murein hydrolase activator NlpD